MPGHYHSEKSGIDVDQIRRRSPSSRTSTYPAAEHRAPDERHRVARPRGGLHAPRVPRPERLPAGDVQAVQRRPRRAHERLHERLQHRPRGRAATTCPSRPQERTATIAVVGHGRRGRSSSTADVAVTNLTGHRFPSGVGFRRAFIELLVVETADGRQRLVWASGRTNSVGVIVDGRRPGRCRRSSSPTTRTRGAGAAALPAAPRGDHLAGSGADLRGADQERRRDGSRPASSAATRR